MKSPTTRVRDRSAGLSVTALKAEVRIGAASTAFGPRRRSSEARSSINIRLAAPQRRLGGTVPARQTGPFENLGDGVLPTEGHNVHAGVAGELAYLLDDLGAPEQALGSNTVARHAAQASDERVGHVHARHFAAHVFERAQRLHRPDPGQHVAALVEAEVADLLHPL